MKARRLIDGAAYGPNALKALGQAFDEVWASIAGNFGDIERARLKLATALLSVTIMRPLSANGSRVHEGSRR